MQIGCYFEAFGAGAQTLAKVAGIKLKKNWRGFRFGAGFPQRFLPKILAELEKQRVPVTILRQTGHELRHTKERLCALIVEYPETKSWNDHHAQPE